MINTMLNKQVLVRTKKGKTFVGKLVQVEKDHYLFEGIGKVFKDNVKSMFLWKNNYEVR